MKYKVIIKRRAEKFIRAQNPAQQKRLLEAILRLPDGTDIKRLKGGGGRFFRLRVGGCRVIYTVDDDRLVVWVVAAGNRGDVYK